jgi:hypothetical protein
MRVGGTAASDMKMLGFSDKGHRTLMNERGGWGLGKYQQRQAQKTREP